MSKQDFATRLRGLRLRKGWSQVQAAQEIGVYPRGYQDWENPNKDTVPRPENLRQLAEAFGVTTDFFLGPMEPNRNHVEVTVRLNEIEALLREHDRRMVKAMEDGEQERELALGQLHEARDLVLEHINSVQDAFMGLRKAGEADQEERRARDSQLAELLESTVLVVRELRQEVAALRLTVEGERPRARSRASVSRVEGS